MTKSKFNSIVNCGRWKTDKNSAFTLAEVLITLGIIGVVAAMTIPTLIANTRSQQYRAQFKKTLSTLNQAALMSQAQYDFDFGNIDTTPVADDDPLTTKSLTALFNGTLTGISWNGEIPYNLGEEMGYLFDVLNSSSAFTLSLSDGSSFTFDSTRTEKCTKDRPCGGFIDVNGPKSKPNKFVKCEKEEDTEYIDGNTASDGSIIPSTPCIVSNSSIGDMFPVEFYDSTVEPATNAAAYILQTSK